MIIIGINATTNKKELRIIGDHEDLVNDWCMLLDAAKNDPRVMRSMSEALNIKEAELLSETCKDKEKTTFLAEMKKGRFDA